MHTFPTHDRSTVPSVASGAPEPPPGRAAPTAAGAAITHIANVGTARAEAPHAPTPRDRQPTPIICQHRAALALRWTLRLLLCPPSDTRRDRIVALAATLASCVIGKRLPNEEEIDQFDRCVSGLRMECRKGDERLAQAASVRSMLTKPFSNTRLADANVQGVWIRAGIMIATLWPQREAGDSDMLVDDARPGEISQEVQLLTNQSYKQLVMCANPRDLMECSRDFRMAADRHLLPLGNASRTAVDLSAFGKRLNAAAALTVNDTDYFYGAMGDQLAHAESLSAMPLLEFS